MYDFPEGEAGQQFLQRCADCRDPRENLLVRHHGDIVLGKVHAGFEDGYQFHQLPLCGLQTLRQSAFELARGDLSLVERLRFDQIAHCLSLREINAAIEKSAHGELTGFCQPRATRESILDDVAKDDRRTVARNLDHVVGGVRVRLGEEGDDNLVEALAGRWLDQLTEVCMSRFEVVSMGQPQHGTSDAARLGAREAHYSNAAATKRSGDGNDGVVEMHGKIVADRGPSFGKKAEHHPSVGRQPLLIASTLVPYARKLSVSGSAAQMWGVAQCVSKSVPTSRGYAEPSCASLDPPHESDAERAYSPI